jgi:phosphoribosylanthranilate isomerase
MQRTRVKICGICRPEDAASAAAAGADAIGMVFRSGIGRFVETDLAVQIAAAVPAFVSVVGLFVDAGAKDILAIRSRVPLSAIQLHGKESPRVVAELKPIPVIKALHLDSEIESTLQTWRKAIAELQLTNLAGILLETAGEAPGGSGIANDWNALHRLQTSGALDGLPPLIAAGGLTPRNVGEVVGMIRPYAVDVSSGVEARLREKSPETIAAFIRAVRQADQSTRST